MRTARMSVLLAVVGHIACSSGSARVKAPVAPPADGAGQRPAFHGGTPSLPEHVACLRHPMPGVPGNHTGVDFPAPVGTDVLAPASGKVVKAVDVAAGADAYVSVRFAEGWTYAVHHLSRVDVKVDELVVRGQRLGLSGGAVGADGSGPWTTGPHLHFSVAYAGAFVNPSPYVCPRS